MNKQLINKIDFIEAIEDIQKVNLYQESRNKFFAENGADGYIYEPECCATVVKLLHIIFGNLDSEEDIARFCFQGNFGKKKKECVFKDAHGQETTILSADALYDYLLEQED